VVAAGRVRPGLQDHRFVYLLQPVERGKQGKPARMAGEQSSRQRPRVGLLWDGVGAIQSGQAIGSCEKLGRKRDVPLALVMENQRVLDVRRQKRQGELAMLLRENLHLTAALHPHHRRVLRRAAGRHGAGALDVRVPRGRARHRPAGAAWCDESAAPREDDRQRLPAHAPAATADASAVVRLAPREANSETPPLRRLAAVHGPCPSLAHLHLRGNGIGAEGAGRLAAMLGPCPSLAHLNLDSNGIGAEGAGRLAAVPVPCPSLAHLDLWRDS